MKVVAGAKDWKEQWTHTDLNRCCKIVGGKRLMHEITETGGDFSVMIFCSHQVDFQKVWDAGDCYLLEDDFEAPTFAALIKKIKKFRKEREEGECSIS
jgi:hypothetical protein